MSKEVKGMLAAVVCVLSWGAMAQESEGSSSPTDASSGVSFEVGGFLRLDTAISTTGRDNPNNQGGDKFQDRTIQRQAFAPPNLALGAVNWGAVPLPYADSVRRSDYVDTVNQTVNLSVLRAEAEVSVHFTPTVDLITRVRALYQPGDLYDEFDADDVKNEQGGITGGYGSLYHGKPNYFSYRTDGGGKNSQLFELSGRNYQVYLPAFVLDYHDNGLNVRLGNQQIAWGQALYLRVFDSPNGLDLRRHIILDRGLEEFSDKRVPMLSLRVSAQVTDTILFDSYIGKFQPTVYPNPNTPYSLITSMFTIHDRFDDDWGKLSGGFRIKGEYGTYGFQAAFVRRYNPDGVFSWTESGVNKPLAGGVGSLGNFLNTSYGLRVPGCATYNVLTCRMYGDTGEALSHSPFEVAPAGVYSANEWFDAAGIARLNGIEGLNTAIEEFPALLDVFYASPAANKDEAMAELNTAFIAAGGSMRGHIQREYFAENIISLGGSYVVESANEFLNEMIFNLEGQYTPKRRFTAPTLSQHYISQDEYTIALVVDKWHRFFTDIPATYMVFELETKQRSDLVGRSLSGFGGSEDRNAPGKSGNANYFVFGFSQPFPRKTWEAEFAMLWDIDGGIYLQPGGRWNPGHNFRVEAFYNYLNGNLYGRRNDNVISSIDFADEVSLRFTYQF